MKNIHIILAAIFIVAACQKTENAPLKAEFESDTQEIGIGEKVTFKDISSGNPSRWNWTFEGGEPETSVLFAPEVVYNNPGTYSVKLTVQRGDQTSEIVKEDFITVSYPSEISVDFTADRTSVTNGETVTFSDRSTGYPDKWTWTFTSDGGKTYTSSEQNPEIIFEEVGIYSVKLVAENPVCKGEKEIKDYMDKKGADYDYVQSEGFGSVERLAGILANNGYRTIVVVGGDGALNDAINGIMLSDAEDKENIAVGIIPNGIGNDFAKYWGIDTEYKKAAPLQRTKPLLYRNLNGKQPSLWSFGPDDPGQHNQQYPRQKQERRQYAAHYPQNSKNGHHYHGVQNQGSVGGGVVPTGRAAGSRLCSTTGRGIHPHRGLSIRIHGGGSFLQKSNFEFVLL